MANLIGPQESLLDWLEWRRRGVKKAERPRSVPTEIPKPWQQAAKRLDPIYAA